MPYKCYICKSTRLGNWYILHNPNIEGGARVTTAAARALDNGVTPASVGVCERECCVQRFLDTGYDVMERRDSGPQNQATPTSEEYVIEDILDIQVEEGEELDFCVRVEWVGYDPDTESTWEKLTDMLIDDGELVVDKLRELELPQSLKIGLNRVHGLEL